jgi:pyruvate formate-lyase/glycerol dehydratase family glycyl radical enzyme
MATKIFSPQEARIEAAGEAPGRPAPASSRFDRLLREFRERPPRIAVDRARLLTASFRGTEGLPVVLRWAKALEHIAAHVEISIGEEELIVGRCGPPGRYGILYPELRGAWLEKGLESLATRKEGAFVFTAEDVRIIREEILPYWKGRTIFEANYELLPEATRNLLYRRDDPYTSRYIVLETTTDRTSLQWSLDYAKVLNKGFGAIRREAEGRLSSLDPYSRDNNFENAAFLRAVILVCRAAAIFAGRHAALAREMARDSGEERKRELLTIAEICERVPEHPARTFREALQAQWFSQVLSRFEQFHGGTIGNGRIDQYLYPFFRKDKEAGRLTDAQALELLKNIWLNMAQCVTFRQSGTIAHFEAYPHFEHTTVGGQTPGGEDASNELSYLVLQSKKEFPLDFPDLSVRVHARTPERFLMRVCELIKEGTGFPKLLNDEAIIPLLLAKGAAIEEARDYCGSGCTEARMVNRDTYMTGNSIVNLGAAVEMSLNDGRLRQNGGERVGAATGDPGKFAKFDDLMTAFKAQVESLANHAFIQNRTADTLRPALLAAPLCSSLHDLCMRGCRDIHQGSIEGAVILGSWDPIGFGTAVDSLAAVKKLVYEDRSVAMGELTRALENNFEGQEVLRRMCLQAPKYGNNDPFADSIGLEIEDFFRSLSHRYTTLHGGKLDARYVPVTAHAPLGGVVGATPNGRKAREPLSDGVSPSQGGDSRGPTAVLLSVAKTSASPYKEIAARLLNMKFSPQAVAGESGTRTLAALIRTWCDLKLWHIQFNVVNSETLKAAQRDPEKYRNLLVRVAGYSAYFVDLTPALQEEIIRRTEHDLLQ